MIGSGQLSTTDRVRTIQPPSRLRTSSLAVACLNREEEMSTCAEKPTLASARIASPYHSSLVQALAHRRFRRFALGRRLNCGGTKYSSTHDPVPLTKQELALLCWASAGPTGLLLSDIDSQLGCSTQMRHPGWTFPSPCNNHTTRLMFMNHDGVFLYRPREATKAVHIENEADLGKAHLRRGEKTHARLARSPRSLKEWRITMDW